MNTKPSTCLLVETCHRVGDKLVHENLGILTIRQSFPSGLFYVIKYDKDGKRINEESFEDILECNI